ncbi:hypothetical protein UPYG_G00207240 [Umbra pygmaea]|uniref:Uncharacterized protein n=1 Tax=Umbra pygmaea TaxID=75934 RepID=A0ABD0WPJ6_UMBPY
MQNTVLHNQDDSHPSSPQTQLSISAELLDHHHVTHFQPIAEQGVVRGLALAGRGDVIGCHLTFEGWKIVAKNTYLEGEKGHHSNRPLP